MDELIKELKEKEKQVDTFENDIKSRHLKIQKKQLSVDRLNRKHADLTKNGQDDNVGPQEANKNNLNKEIEQTENDKLQVQNEWIKNQTKLVS